MNELAKVSRDGPALLVRLLHESLVLEKDYGPPWRVRRDLASCIAPTFVGHLGVTPGLDSCASAVARFVAHGQRQVVVDRGVAWTWVKQVCANVGVDAVAVACEAALFVPGELAACDDAPVSFFQLDRERYQLVRVADLPFWDAPGRCAYGPEIERRVQTAQRRARLLDLLRVPGRAKVTQQEVRRRVARDVQQEVIAGRRPACHLHEHVRWDAVTTAAWQIRNSLPEWSEAAVRDACARSALAAVERILLRDLFLDPIRWDGVSPLVNGGQHRLCGLRTAGVATVVAHIG